MGSQAAAASHAESVVRAKAWRHEGTTSVGVVTMNTVEGGSHRCNRRGGQEPGHGAQDLRAGRLILTGRLRCGRRWDANGEQKWAPRFPCCGPSEMWHGPYQRRGWAEQLKLICLCGRRRTVSGQRGQRWKPRVRMWCSCPTGLGVKWGMWTRSRWRTAERGSWQREVQGESQGSACFARTEKPTGG